MNDQKIKQFLELAGQKVASTLHTGTEEQRMLGAKLLLSEVLEYVIHGLGVTPIVDGQPIHEPDELEYTISAAPEPLEMIDGLADVAYTMYWNSAAFGVPLEPAFELVCDNNLEKFVKLPADYPHLGTLPPDQWHCTLGVSWPDEVRSVEVIERAGERFAVGKDGSGKVRKPSHYRAVDLQPLLQVNGRC